MPKLLFTFAFLAVVCVVVSMSVPQDIQKQADQPNEPEKSLPKRSLGGLIVDGGAGSAIAAPWATTAARFNNGFAPSWNQYSSRLMGVPSPNEVAHAIAAAKQATENVLIAQQQMQAAKENVLNQQRKETAAAILSQKSEAAAAIQRSEAAQAVILAQQRLAASKAAVAHQQRLAAAKEAEAAAILQRSAAAAAAEIQKSEYEAAKFGPFTRNGNAGLAHHFALSKDAAFNPLATGANHIGLDAVLNPWVTAARANRNPLAPAWF